MKDWIGIIVFAIAVLGGWYLLSKKLMKQYFSSAEDDTKEAAKEGAKEALDEYFPILQKLFREGYPMPIPRDAITSSEEQQKEDREKYGFFHPERQSQVSDSSIRHQPRMPVSEHL